MFQASSSSYKILSQEPLVDEKNENDFSSSLSSDESEDSLDLVLNKIRNQRPKRKYRTNHHRIEMARIDGFDAAAESYENQWNLVSVGHQSIGQSDSVPSLSHWCYIFFQVRNYSVEELIGSAKRRRQFLIIAGLSILAIAVILAIILSVMLVNKSPEENLEKLELEDILRGKLQHRRFNGTWIDDNKYHYFDSNGDFLIFNAANKSREIRVKATSDIYEKFISSSSFEFSADGKYILLDSSIIKLYRHSFFAVWRIFDIEKGTITDVKINEDEDDQSVYRLVKFGPVGSSMIIIDKYNIYYKSSVTSSAIQVTTDGDLTNTEKIVNGVPDWVYEEEVLSSNSATWFSKDGKKIAFLQFDDTKVPTVSLSLYGLPGQYKYPEMYPVSYPKVGAKNPVVRLFYVNLDNFDSKNLLQIKKPEDLDDDYLITSVGWANEKELISVWMNRVQNKGLIFRCIENVCANILTLDRNDGWIEFFTAPIFNGDGSQMFFIGSTNNYRHIKVLNLNTTVLVNRTSGNYIVTEILKYNKHNNVIIYTANTESDIKAQHVYAIKNVDGAKPVCLTCKLFDQYSYYSAELSEDGTYLIINSEGLDIPRSDLYTLKVEGDNILLTDHMEIEKNDIVRKVIDKKSMPRKIFDSIKINDEAEASVMMIVPSNLDDSKKYPLLVEVYGGPDSSSVTNRFSVEWGTYLASNLGIVYAKIDGRGSGLKSDTHLHALYKRLGTVEVEDQVTTAQKLFEKYSYLDKDRAGIWGWSYGGYVSGMSLMQTNSSYKCATSVAPVTDWELYDSIYTERYMGLPEENLEAYNTSRIANFVNNIQKFNKQYMLVHGTLDDNVHFQQGMVLARVLERKDIQFKEITYPDEDHSLAGVRPHLYHSLEKFFRDCFDLKKEE